MPTMVRCSVKSIVTDVLYASLALFLTGCTTKGPVYTQPQQPSNDESLVVVYRRFTGLSNNLPPCKLYLYGEDKQIATIYSLGYTYFYTTPGQLKMTYCFPWYVTGGPRWFNKPLSIWTLAGGETYYFAPEMVNKGLYGTYSLNRIENAVAVKELQSVVPMFGDMYRLCPALDQDHVERGIPEK